MNKEYIYNIKKEFNKKNNNLEGIEEKYCDLFSKSFTSQSSTEFSLYKKISNNNYLRKSFGTSKSNYIILNEDEDDFEEENYYKSKNLDKFYNKEPEMFFIFIEENKKILNIIFISLYLISTLIYFIVNDTENINKYYNIIESKSGSDKIKMSFSDKKNIIRMNIASTFINSATRRILGIFK